jgi:hypothetical protein
MSYPRPIHPTATIGTRSPYESFWDASRRQAAEAAKAQSRPPTTPRMGLALSAVAAPVEREPTRTDVMSVLAKKTTKEVREWFREQIEGLDDSSSD